MKPAARPDPATDNIKHPPPIATALDIGLAVVACGAFVIAKSVATAGRVSIDAVEYWLIGALPLAVLYGLSLVAERLLPGTGRDPVARKFVVMWIFDLVLFCVSKDLHVYETIRDGLETTLSIGRATSELGMALLIASLGSMIVVPNLILSSENKVRALGLSLAAVLLSAAMMYALLLWR